MTRRDAWLGGVFAAAAAALLFPAWCRPGFALENFGDLYAYHYPLRHLAYSGLQGGRLPFWNPYIFSGLPLAANTQSALYDPVALLGALFPLTAAFSWGSLFHLAWAALGAALLARRAGVGPAARWSLAATYALSPFLFARIAEGIPTLAASLAWAPWCWLAWGSRKPGFLAAAWALQFVSGHPQFLAINAGAMALWAVAARSRKGGLVLIKEGAASAALTAVSWGPAREFLARSIRADWPGSFALAYSIPWSSLKAWIWPGALGEPWAGTFSGPPSVYFETAALSLGLPAAALALYGFRRAPKAAALTAAGVFLAAGGHSPIYRLLARGPLALSRTPARFFLLAWWGGWLAVGAACRPRGRRAWTGLLIAASALQLFVWDWRHTRVEPVRPYLDVNEAFAKRVGGAPFRVMTDPGLASPDKAMLYRAMNVNGYDAYYLSGYPSYVARSEGRPAADGSRVFASRCETPEMRRLSVSYFLEGGGRMIGCPGALPLASFERDRSSPRVEVERAERWRVEGLAPLEDRRLVLSIPFFPGWRAALGGGALALSPWGGFLSSVELPASAAGRPFSLALSYEPTSWPLWASLSVAAWALWFLRLAGARA